MAAYHSFEANLSSLISREIDRLVDEIAWIDSRLLELGKSDEELVERKLLKILRRHLMKDLYELVGFVWDEEESHEEEVTISSTMEALAVETF